MTNLPHEKPVMLSMYLRSVEVFQVEFTLTMRFSTVFTEKGTSGIALTQMAFQRAEDILVSMNLFGLLLYLFYL